MRRGKRDRLSVDVPPNHTPRLDGGLPGSTPARRRVSIAMTRDVDLELIVRSARELHAQIPGRTAGASRQTAQA